MGKALKTHFSREDIHVVNKLISKWSTSLIIREMQMKRTVRYHLTPYRMAIIYKSTKNKCCGEHKDREIPPHIRQNGHYL